MSDSAKKKLKQMRLPFAVIATETGTSPKVAENSPLDSASRKRKLSNEGNNTRSNKIGRVVESKENIVSKPDVIDVADSDEDLLEEVEEGVAESEPVESEKTPTTNAPESVLHIKLPSCTKSKRKVNMDVKPPKSVDEEDEDDSVVYLDEEEVREISKKLKKSAKKSKKKKGSQSSKASRVKKVLNMSSSAAPEKAETTAEDSFIIDDDDDLKPENDDESPPTETLPEPSTVESPDAIKLPEEETESPDTIKTIPSSSTSPPAVDPEEIHDEIMEMLSDDSESNKNVSINQDDSGRNPTSSKFDIMNLTPKQLARRQELESRRIEKELQRQRERDLKEQQRLKEKEQREEAKRKEKEEKEEARKKEKEERDRKRQAEQDKKDEEKRLKEEERKRTADQRDEEKRQKEEERKRQVEQREEEKRKREEAAKKKEVEEENRKKRAAQAFSKFFVAKKKNETSGVEDETSKDSAENSESNGVKSDFKPFQIRERMTVAPCVRLVLSKDQLEELTEALKTEKPVTQLYLNELRNGSHKPKFSEKTVSIEEKEVDGDDVIIVDDLEGVGENIQADLVADDMKMKMKIRAKFLSFNENRRPAYRGTWRKKASNITARRPFAKDSKFFDYDVDSDDEWEDEEPGESLHGSDSEKEKDIEEDEYEVDNEFFVPHGHLSDTEMQQMDDEMDEDNRPEAQKAKLKILQQEFAAEMKKKTEKIKPRLIGCIWMNGDEDETGCSNTEKKYHCSDIIWRILKAREMMTSEDAIKLEDDLEPEVAEPEEEVEKVTAQPKIRAKINEGSVKQLSKLIHGNLNNKKFICKEFQAYRLKNFHKDSDFQEYSVKSVEEKMMEISDYKTCAEEGSMFGKKCWLVKPEVIDEHFGDGDEKLKLPNEWTYILEKKPKPQATVEGAKKESPATEVSIKPKYEEKSEQTEVKSQPAPAPIVKKRVQLLMSVPRGQEISQAKKNTLISSFLKDNKETSSSKVNGGNEKQVDVIVID